MPRGSRIDAAGALHHVRVSGIETGVVFQNDKGRRDAGKKISNPLDMKGDGVNLR
jgi:hypothetical protein